MGRAERDIILKASTQALRPECAETLLPSRAFSQQASGPTTDPHSLEYPRPYPSALCYMHPVKTHTHQATSTGHQPATQDALAGQGIGPRMRPAWARQLQGPLQGQVTRRERAPILSATCVTRAGRHPSAEATIHHTNKMQASRQKVHPLCFARAPWPTCVLSKTRTHGTQPTQKHTIKC